MEHEQLIFIVGMYKCGTSWLLNSLCAHDECNGLREIDVLRNVYTYKPGRDTEVKEPLQRVTSFFGGNAWCPVFGKDLQGNIQTAINTGGIEGLNRMQDMLKESLPENPAINNKDMNDWRPKNIKSMTAKSAMQLMEDIYNADSPRKSCEIFISRMYDNLRNKDRLVVKAADQLPLFDTLEKWFPESKKIAIIRDGRDAVISASHYRKLMQQKQAPWAGQSKSYTQLLVGWKKRADILSELAKEKKLIAVRYEDLSSDYLGTFSRILSSLNLNNDQNLVREIESKTSFETLTGRKRGTSANSVIRRGMVGEWAQEMDTSSKKECWEYAKDTLSKFGYTVDGNIIESKLVI